MATIFPATDYAKLIAADTMCVGGGYNVVGSAPFAVT